MKLDIEKALEKVEDIKKSLDSTDKMNKALDKNKPEHEKDEKGNIEAKEKAGNKDKDLDKVKKSEAEPAGKIPGQEKDDATNGFDKAPKAGSKDNDVGVKVKKDADEKKSNEEDCDDGSMKKSFVGASVIDTQVASGSEPIVKSLELISELVKSYNEVTQKNIDLNSQVAVLQKSLDEAKGDLEKSVNRVSELEKSMACDDKKAKKDVDGDEDGNDDSDVEESEKKSKDVKKSVAQPAEDSKEKVEKSTDKPKDSKEEPVEKAISSVDDLNDKKIKKSAVTDEEVSKDEFLGAIRKSIITYSGDYFRSPSQNSAIGKLQDLAQRVEAADSINKSMLDEYQKIDF